MNFGAANKDTNSLLFAAKIGERFAESHNSFNLCNYQTMMNKSNNKNNNTMQQHGQHDYKQHHQTNDGYKIKAARIIIKIMYNL